MNTYSESRIELQNLQILKKMLEKSSQFLTSEQPRKPKSLNVALNIAGVERIRSKNLRLRSTMNERSLSDGGKLCPLWLVILKSVRRSIGDT